MLLGGLSKIGWDRDGSWLAKIYKRKRKKTMTCYVGDKVSTLIEMTKIECVVNLRKALVNDHI